MSTQEMVALYRLKSSSCPHCRRIVGRYEKNLRITMEELQHLEVCLLKA